MNFEFPRKQQDVWLIQWLTVTFLGINEITSWNPYGKPGCGAPSKSKPGQTIWNYKDLRNVYRRNRKSNINLGWIVQFAYLVARIKFQPLFHDPLVGEPTQNPIEKLPKLPTPKKIVEPKVFFPQKIEEKKRSSETSCFFWGGGGVQASERWDGLLNTFFPMDGPCFFDLERKLAPIQFGVPKISLTLFPRLLFLLFVDLWPILKEKMFATCSNHSCL